MDNTELKGRLEAIVRDRNARVPQVGDRVRRLRQVKESLDRLRAAARDLPDDWAARPEVRDALARLGDPDVAARLTEAEGVIASVQARFSRQTINIGVSGRARVGKSTILQSVSGLSDDQVPTGEDLNVTAVRSRLFHASRPRAFLSFHTRQTFLDDVVHPYFQELEISPLPTSVEAFARTELRTELEKRRRTAGLSHQIETRWERLMGIQAALPQVLPLLDRGELVLDALSGLRRFVAYPTAEQIKTETMSGTPAPREYLAVRDCRIESPFPETAVDRLGMVDLPGLGEVASGIDDRIMAGLRDEVDVVLLVKRAAVGLSNVDDIDSKAADLIRTARSDIDDSRDFAWIVINASDNDASRVDALKIDILNKLNFGVADSRYLTLQADGRDARDVHEKVLVPVLDRLAE